MLTARSIDKNFGENRVLSDIDIGIRPGSITILTGPSGSGKSTLIRCLSLLDRPSKGEIEVDGVKYSFPNNKLPNKENVYPKITCVFQQLYLWPHLTNRENIILALSSKYNKKHLDKYVDLFQMAGFIDKYPNHSSLGQRQRVSLVRALVLNPKYLLLDEVTSALDSHNTNIVFSELSRISENDVGILLVSHDHRIISNNKFTTLLLENGRLSGDASYA